MKEEKLIEERFGRDPGFRVPEGYFDEVFDKISSELPEYTADPPAPKLTVWQKIRPYVYLAAMFCGIWCMMKMFHVMSGAASSDLTLNTPPEAVAVVMADPEAYEIYTTDSYESDFELESEVLAQYDNIDDFKRDFNYEMKPEYASMKVPV